MSWVTLEKKTFPTTLFVYPLWGICFVCKIYIFAYIAKMATFQSEVANSKFFNFFKIWHLSFEIHFLSREAIKTRWDRAFWNKIPKKVRFLVLKSDSTITLARYIITNLKVLNCCNCESGCIFWPKYCKVKILRKSHDWHNPSRQFSTRSPSGERLVCFWLLLCCHRDSLRELWNF